MPKIYLRKVKNTTGGCRTNYCGKVTRCYFNTEEQYTCFGKYKKYREDICNKEDIIFIEVFKDTDSIDGLDEKKVLENADVLCKSGLFDEMIKDIYCEKQGQPDFCKCEKCSLVNYGMDCQNNKISEGYKNDNIA